MKKTRGCLLKVMQAQNTTRDDKAAAERKETWEFFEKNQSEQGSDHVWLYVKPDEDGNHKRIPKFMCPWIQFSLRNYCVDRDKWNENFRKRRENGYEDRVC